jgi:hypothetical protein
MSWLIWTIMVDPKVKTKIRKLKYIKIVRKIDHDLVIG